MSRLDPMVRARAAWGEPPDWVAALAHACQGATFHQIACRLGYSAGTIHDVLSARYAAGLDGIEAAVRAVLMGRAVTCPVLGEISGETCRTHQRAPYAGGNPRRVALYRACRSGCAHSTLERKRR